MATVDGYAMSSWESGYGDMVLTPDLDTLRPVPWQEGTVVCLADVAWPDGSDVAASPRQILRGQLARLARARLERQRGHGARVHGVPGQLRGGVAQGLSRPASGEPVQRRLLAAGHRARGAADPPHPQQHGRGGDGRGGLQGRVQLRPARDQLPLRGRAAHCGRALDLQERREGDRGAGGRGDHVHGQVRPARGQLLPHPFLACRRARPAVRARGARCSSRSSPASWRACAR